MKIFTKRVPYKYIILIPILIYIAGRTCDFEINKDIYLKYFKIKPNMSEKDVYKIMGDPYKVIVKGQAFVEGYKEPNKNISNKAFIYYGGFDKIVYIFIDNKGKVEYVFITGS
jgi:hypothetical protein